MSGDSTKAPQPRSLRRKLIRALVLYVLVPCTAVTLLLFLLQRKLMYRPTQTAALPVADAGFESGLDVEIQTPESVTLRGWLVKSTASSLESSERALVIYFPGNAQNRAERADDLREVAREGYDVLIFDYRGYGDSEGSPRESDMISDARLVWDYAIQTVGYSPDRTVIFGESLGGAVALSLWDKSNSASPRPRAILLNSTFSSMPQAVAATYPGLPFHWLVLDRWPSNERIKEVSCPITIFHGTADEMVPFSHAEELKAAARHARLIRVPGGQHNLVPTHQLRAALRELRPRRP